MKLFSVIPLVLGMAVSSSAMPRLEDSTDMDAQAFVGLAQDLMAQGRVEVISKCLPAVAEGVYVDPAYLAFVEKPHC